MWHTSLREIEHSLLYLSIHLYLAARRDEETNLATGVRGDGGEGVTNGREDGAEVASHLDNKWQFQPKAVT